MLVLVYIVRVVDFSGSIIHTCALQMMCILCVLRELGLLKCTSFYTERSEKMVTLVATCWPTY